MKKTMMTAIMIFSAVIALTACGNNTGTETANEEETVTEKTMSQDFDSGTNQTLYFGDVAFQIPSTWIAAEDNTEDDMTFWVDSTMFYVSYSQYHGEITEEESANKLIEGMEEAIDSDDLERINYNLVNILGGDKTAVYYEATCTVSGVQMHVYFIAVSIEDNSHVLTCALYDSDVSQYDHSEDYFSAMNSMYYL